MHEVNLIQLKTLNLTSHSIYSTLMCRLRIIAGLPITVYRVTSYLRLLALFILYYCITCSPNISFLARLVLEVWEKNELGHVFPQPHQRKKISMGFEFLFVATCASDLTFLAPLTSAIYKRFPQIWGP